MILQRLFLIFSGLIFIMLGLSFIPGTEHVFGWFVKIFSLFMKYILLPVGLPVLGIFTIYAGVMNK